MSKIIPAERAGVPAVPEHLRSVPVEEHGTEILAQYVIPPRLKIVQPSARKPFSELFRQGDLIQVPSMQLVAAFADRDSGKLPAMACTPIFMWPEWCIWNPLEAKGTLPVIRGRTLDPTSQIAVKARDPDKREAEYCPEVPDKKLKYVEHLNWILYPHNGPIAGVPIAISFFRGSWMAGSQFSGLIQARKAPMYGCNFELFIRERENQKGRFFVPNMDNPSASFEGGAWVGDALFQEFKKAHAQFKEDYNKKRLRVDYDDHEDDIEGEAQPVAEAQKF